MLGELFGVCCLVIARGPSPRDDNRGLVQNRELCQRRRASTTDYYISCRQGCTHLVNIGDAPNPDPSLPLRGGGQGVRSGNDQKLEIWALVVRGYCSFCQGFRSAAAAKDQDRLFICAQTKALRIGPSGENLWADGQPRDSAMSRPEPPCCARVREKDPSGPWGKEPGHQPGEEILLVYIEGNSKKSSPKQGGKRPVASKADDRCRAHLQDDPERLGERDGDLGYSNQRPERPPRALARTRDPTNRELIELNPGVPRQHARFKSIAAAYVDKPSIGFSARKPL